MIGVIATLAVGALVFLVVDSMINLDNKWGEQALPEAAQVELSETDNKMVERSGEVIREVLGENAVETLRNASNKERINLIDTFATQLAEAYGLDIEIDVTVDDMSHCGHYNWSTKKAYFNVAWLMVDSNSPNFAASVREVIDTVVHELRHAVQSKAIEDPGFWDIDENRRNAWQSNMSNYISPSVDIRAYASQPMEADATSFAAAVMRGV